MHKKKNEKKVMDLPEDLGWIIKMYVPELVCVSCGALRACLCWNQTQLLLGNNWANEIWLLMRECPACTYGRNDWCTCSIVRKATTCQLCNARLNPTRYAENMRACKHSHRAINNTTRKKKEKMEREKKRKKKAKRKEKKRRKREEARKKR